MELTTLLLSQWNSTLLPDSSGPQIAQLRTIGASCFAIMSICAHSLDHASCIHWDPNTAPQPHDPDASEAIMWSGVEPWIKLSPF